MSEFTEGITADNPRIGWHNIITADNLLADEEAADLPASNLANPATYLKWRGETDGEQSLTITAAAEVNYFAIAGHNLATSTIAFEASDDGVAWDTIIESVPGSNFALIHEFENVEAGYFRLRITPAVGIIPECAVMHVGRILRCQRRLYVGHAPMTLNRKTIVSTGRSENGQYLGRVRRSQSLETEVAFKNITPSWYRSFFDPFVTHAEEGAFFWAWRPETYPDEVGYSWVTADPEVDNQRANGMVQVNMSLQGIR